MWNATELAGSVANWTGIARVPEDLTKAIDLYEAILYTEVGYTPVVKLEDVNKDNIEQVIWDHARALSLASTPIGVLGPQGHGPLERSKAEVLDVAAREVIHQGRLAVPAIIEKLTPAFDKSAEAYVAAVTSLPKDITADALVKAGTKAIEAYEVALREMKYLNIISGWVASAGRLNGYTKETYPAVRILRPATLMELIKLENAQSTWSQSEVLRSLDPALVTAAQLGVEFKINTIKECADMTSALRSEQTRWIPSRSN